MIEQVEHGFWMPVTVCVSSPAVSMLPGWGLPGIVKGPYRIVCEVQALRESARARATMPANPRRSEKRGSVLVGPPYFSLDEARPSSLDKRSVSQMGRLVQ